MMKNNKKLPKGLVEKQELQRQETINKVLRACADIKGEGKIVTIAALMEYTGLSRSTFSKPHIRELLLERGYASGNNTALSKRKNIKQAEAIAEKDRKIAELGVKNSKLERECETLRGRLFLLMQKEEIKHGI